MVARRWYILAVFLLTGAGCRRVFVDYYPSAYPPTSNVRVYGNRDSLPESYVEFGRIAVGVTGWSPTEEDVRQELAHAAMARGANALIDVRVRHSRKGGGFWSEGTLVRYRSQIPTTNDSTLRH